MNLAYITGSYPTPSETFIRREIEGLRARGHRVDVFALFPPEIGREQDVTYGWTTAAARVARRMHRSAADKALGRRWRQEFAARGISLVLAHFASAPSTVALMSAGDLPLVISLHARDLYVEAEQLAEKCARAAAVVTCTRANVEYLRAQYPACAARIHLVYHGLPADWLAAPLPARRRVAGEPIRLLAVGRFVAKKGFAVLLDACPRLLEAGVTFRLSLIGDGSLRPALEAQCRETGIAGAVTLPGWQSEVEIRQAYAGADLFICPSLLAADGDRDGLPNVLVEAQSTGLPAVGSRLSGIPEAIEADVTGLLVATGDADALARAIAQLAGDPARRAAMGAAAAQHVRAHFDGARWLDTLEDLLHAAR